jgi:hypothetical protein
MFSCYLCLLYFTFAFFFGTSESEGVGHDACNSLYTGQCSSLSDRGEEY